MSSSAQQREWQQGDQVVLMENSSDEILNVMYCGKHAEIASTESSERGYEFVTIQVLDATRKQLEWPKDCLRIISNNDSAVDTPPKKFYFLKFNQTDAWGACQEMLNDINICTITTLHIQFVARDIPADSVVTLGCALPSLQAMESLIITGPHPCGKIWPSPIDTQKCLRIESDTLRHLDVSQMHPGAFVTCRCPLLETFLCQVKLTPDSNGNFFPQMVNGSIPELTRVQLDAITNNALCTIAHDADNSIQLVDTDRKSLKVRAGCIPLLGMEIPDQCWCTVTNFCEMKALASFTEYSQLLRWIRSSQEKSPTI